MSTLQYLNAIPYHTYTWTSFAIGVTTGGLVIGASWLFTSMF